jgi:protein-disulfide isomerase
MSESCLTVPVGADDHLAGALDAPALLVEYGDYECPYCGAAYPIVKKLQRELGDRLTLVFRNFPLTEAHPHAERAAEAAEAAGAQGKFWEMHDLLFERQDALASSDLADYARHLRLDDARVARELAEGTWRPRVRADFRGGVRSGVNGTPTFFINGERFDGDWADERLFGRALREAAEHRTPV